LLFILIAPETCEIFDDDDEDDEGDIDENRAIAEEDRTSEECDD